MDRLCNNPKHKEPKPAAFVYDEDWLKKPTFLCDTCAWVADRLLTEGDLQELAEWQEEQLSEEEKRQRDRDDYHDREYHRRKDEGK